MPASPSCLVHMPCCHVCCDPMLLSRGLIGGRLRWSVQVEMKETIERERATTAAVKQLRNEVREERQEHEEKVGALTAGASLPPQYFTPT
jgi:hypothetical protein